MVKIAYGELKEDLKESGKNAAVGAGLGTLAGGYTGAKAMSALRGEAKEELAKKKGFFTRKATHEKNVKEVAKTLRSKGTAALGGHMKKGLMLGGLAGGLGTLAYKRDW